MTIAKATLQTDLTTERFHGLDAARAIALIIGIVHHGIESMVTYAKWDWVTQDSQSSILLDVAFYVSHVFRMQAFFLMSGFFVHLLISKKGMKNYLLNRFKRLVVPFALFWPLLYSATYYLWVWGIQYNQHLSYSEAVAKLPNYMMWSKGFPLMHLWFLYFLILYCFATGLIRPALLYLDRSLAIRKVLDSVTLWCMERWYGSLAIGLIMSLPMLWMKDWFGVDTSASGLLPKIAPLILYGMYFAFGYVLHRQANLMENFVMFRKWNLTAGLVLILTLIVLNLSLSETQTPNINLVLMGLNFIYAFASVATVFAFIGYMMSWFKKPSKNVRYLSDSAYWGYLVHLPIIAFFQIMLAQVDMHWALKLILIFAPTVALLAISYRYAVRSTFIGQLLNGQRKF